LPGRENGGSRLVAEVREMVPIFMQHFVDQVMGAQQPEVSAHPGRATPFLLRGSGGLGEEQTLQVR